jgi:hypothetical protein
MIAIIIETSLTFLFVLRPSKFEEWLFTFHRVYVYTFLYIYISYIFLSVLWLYKPTYITIIIIIIEHN